MGLDFNKDKTGSVRITSKPSDKSEMPSDLPQGNIRWGFLKLDAASGRFLTDQVEVDKHIEECHIQLSCCTTIFDWIQAWNVYRARFFANNFGRLANCYGRTHVDDMLDTFARIQRKLFESTGGSIETTLKRMITDRFNVQNVPEGYLFFPVRLSGLRVKNPFIDLYLVRNTLYSDGGFIMDLFFDRKKAQGSTRLHK